MRRTHNPAWADRTNTARQRRRLAALNCAAAEAGFATWRRLETAVINGARITVEGAPADQETNGAALDDWD